MNTRTCCGQNFSDMDLYAAHLATHNSTPAQWTEAYNSIQRAKERKKSEAKHSEEGG